jgi:hypothetical protein
MERLTSAATSAGGLGTEAARWAFLFGLACSVLQGFVDGTFATSPLVWAAALTAALCGFLILTTPGAHLLSPAAAWSTVAAALFVAAATLWSAPAVTELWGLGLAAYLATFLIVRGNVVAGMVGGVLVPGIAALWAWPRGPSPEEWALLVGIPIGSLAAAWAWRLVLRWIVGLERVHRTDAAQAEERAAADAEALAATRKELAGIRAEVTGLLGRIASGERIDDELRTELSCVEAGVRDRIRAPHLNHPDLLATIATIRRRGVEVVLLGEPRRVGERVSDRLAMSICRLIDVVAAGRVTIRTLPEGRAAAASVVISQAGVTDHVQFSADGTLLTRA